MYHWKLNENKRQYESINIQENGFRKTVQMGNKILLNFFTDYSRH